ncbi:MAG: hypothetical protein V1694_04500 [Candidatus Eisenbacteria bacterium]
MATAKGNLRKELINHFGLSTARAADQLLRYDWPGNVRELENGMERAVAVGRANLTELEDLPEEVRQAIPTSSVSSPVRALGEIEKDYLLKDPAPRQCTDV